MPAGSDPPPAVPPVPPLNANDQTLSCRVPIQVYYYDWDKPKFGIVSADGYPVGHFCQVVWGDATEVGMAHSTVGNGSYVFAFYDEGTGSGIDTRHKQLKETWLRNVKINKAGRNIIRANMERMGMGVEGNMESVIKPKAG